jgi:hypothetical protein
VSKRIYLLFGRIPLWGVDYGDEEQPLTAADNGGTTYSERIDVPLGFGQPEWDQRWDEERKK